MKSIGGSNPLSIMASGSGIPRLAYQYLRDYLVFIPGENPSQMRMHY